MTKLFLQEKNGKDIKTLEINTPAPDIIVLHNSGIQTYFRKHLLRKFGDASYRPASVTHFSGDKP